MKRNGTVNTGGGALEEKPWSRVHRLLCGLFISVPMIVMLISLVVTCAGTATKYARTSAPHPQPAQPRTNATISLVDGNNLSDVGSLTWSCGQRTAPAPLLTSVGVCAVTSPDREHSAQRHTLTYTIYATREGLVGRETANGHIIQPDDHFVALPSWRVLSSNGSEQCSVRIRNPLTGLSEVAPVWDIGPWNEQDDYWTSSSKREAWNDLREGTPQAKAAHLNGYNMGKSGTGSQVLNPAGIDLADGTFKAIGMTDNGNVEVTFLLNGPEHGPCRVIPYQHANVRNTPHLSGTIVSYVEAGQDYPHVCWQIGDVVTDHGVTNNVWIKLPLNAGGFGYVSAVYLKGDKNANLSSSTSCHSSPIVTIRTDVPGIELNVHAAPQLADPAIGTLLAGDQRHASCWTTGDAVSMLGVDSDIWVKILSEDSSTPSAGYAWAGGFKGDKFANVTNHCN